MISLSLSYEIGEITIVAKDDLAQASLQRLAKVMGLKLQNRELDTYDVEYRSNDPNFITPQYINYYFDKSNIAIVQHMNRGMVFESYEWMYIIILGVLRKLANNEKVFLLHCATLEKNQKSVLLFGRSGIGKSTTARRVCEAGGVCRGDDLALCYLHNNKLFAQILPTFSAFRLNENWGELHYNFEPALEVKKLYLLDRGENCSSVELNEPKEFQAVLIEAMSLHLVICWKRQPPTLRKICINHILDLAFELTKKFPPMTIKAHLEHDIAQLQLFK